MKQIIARVTENRELSYGKRPSGSRVLLGFRLIWLDCPQIETPQPGQFVMVKCGEENVLPRPFSIHRASGSKIAVWVAVWENGAGTMWLAKRRTGDEVAILGPLGNSYSLRPETENILLLAGGVGVAPLYFLAQEAIGKQKKVTLINAASKEPNLYPEEFPTGTEVIRLDEKKTGQKITDIIPQYLDGAGQVFACGPSGMYRAMAQMPELEDKTVQVSLETRMGCGRGVCYSCTVRTRQGLRQVCEDGPIFNLEDIIWDELSV